MIAGFHLVWTAYGWWMPNDPRGSSSREIRNDLIADLGELHFGRKNVQPSGRTMREFHQAASAKLEHELRPFSEDEFAVIAASFSDVIKERVYTCYACAMYAGPRSSADPQAPRPGGGNDRAATSGEQNRAC
jgi:hypothetical protein